MKKKSKKKKKKEKEKIDDIEEVKKDFIVNTINRFKIHIISLNIGQSVLIKLQKIHKF